MRTMSYFVSQVHFATPNAFQFVVTRVHARARDGRPPVLKATWIDGNKRQLMGHTVWKWGVTESWSWRGSEVRLGVILGFRPKLWELAAELIGTDHRQRYCIPAVATNLGCLALRPASVYGRCRFILSGLRGRGGNSSF